MAPTVKKPETAAAAAPAKGSKKKPHGTPRNYDLGNGVVRFSRSRTYHKKALYKFMGKKTAKAETPKKPVSVEKPIGGDKNGGTRTVKLHKRHGLYPTQKEYVNNNRSSDFELELQLHYIFILELLSTHLRNVSAITNAICDQLCNLVQFALF